MSTIKAHPHLTSSIYQAAAYIEKSGPVIKEVLFANVDFGPLRAREDKLKIAFEIEWLCETAAGSIDLTTSTREYFARKAAKPKYVGEKAPAPYRASVFASPGLSKKNIPNSRGMRQDTPTWSHRPPGFGFKSIAGGE